MRFTDRTDAGAQLGRLVAGSGLTETALVLGLPRGGVPVAAGVAAALSSPLDVVVVRKVGVPGREELAMGAVASGGAVVTNETIRSHFGITDEVFDGVLRREVAELERRERLYRGGRGPLPIAGRDVVIVDDGSATGASMTVAVAALATHQPASITVALPIASRDAVSLLEQSADRVIVVSAPEPFSAVGYWYADFAQTEDHEVTEILGAASA